MQAYGANEIVVYGGGEIYRDVLNGVVQLTASSALNSVITVFLLCGLLGLLFKVAFSFQVGELLKWLIVVVIIYGVLWLPRTSVHVTDRFNSGLAGADIANVPVSIATIASISTEIGDTAIKGTELVFGNPAGLSYSTSGMIYGAKIFSSLPSIAFITPGMAQNVNNYLQQCAFQQINTQQITQDTIMYSTQLWADLSANPPANGNTFYTALTSGATGSLISCATAATDISADFANETKNQKPSLQGLLQSVLSTQLKPGSPYLPSSDLDATIPNLTQAAMGTSYSSDQILQQALMIQALHTAVAAYGGQTSLASSISEAQGQRQETSLAQSVGSAAQTTIPILQCLFTVLFIGMFPVLFPGFLIPSAGVGLLKNYISSFVFLQLWGPMYVILNQIFLYATDVSIGASSLVGNGVSAVTSGSGLTYANFAVTCASAIKISNTAGMMMASIPVIAGMLTKGLMDTGGQAVDAFGAARRGAEARSEIQSTGNLSLDNVSLRNTNADNASYNNVQANKVNTDHEVFTGASTYRTPEGTTFTRFSGGNQIVRAANSSLLESFGLSEAERSTATQQAQVHAARGDVYRYAKDHGYSVQVSDTVAKSVSDYVTQHAGHTTGDDVRQVIEKSFRNADEQSRSGGRSNTSDVRAGVEGVEGGLPGTPVKGGIKGSVSGSKGQTDSSSSSATRSTVSQQGQTNSSSGFDIKTQGSDVGSSATNNKTHARDKATRDNLNAAIQREDGLTRSYNEIASRESSKSAQHNTDLTQAFVNYSLSRAAEMSKTSPDPLDAGLILNPMSAPASMSAAQRERYQALHDGFVQDFMKPYIDKEVGQSLEAQKLESLKSGAPNIDDLAKRPGISEGDINALNVGLAGKLGGPAPKPPSAVQADAGKKPPRSGRGRGAAPPPASTPDQSSTGTLPHLRPVDAPPGFEQNKAEVQAELKVAEQKTQWNSAFLDVGDALPLPPKTPKNTRADLK